MYEARYQLWATFGDLRELAFEAATLSLVEYTARTNQGDWDIVALVTSVPSGFVSRYPLGRVRTAASLPA